jgi:hypothetical protein
MLAYLSSLGQETGCQGVDVWSFLIFLSVPCQEQLQGPGVGWRSTSWWRSFGEHLANAFRQGVEAEGRDAEEAKRNNQEFLS